MNVVDLSMPIKPHWRWQFDSELALDFEKGDPYQSTSFHMSAHAFTHIDSPLHVEQGRAPLDDTPLDQLVGTAAILDLSYVTANQGIGVDDLENFEEQIVEGDIVVLKTEWDRKEDSEKREFWNSAPYLEREASDWLSKQPITAIGFDFPQDYVVRDLPDRHPPVEEMHAHNLILRKGIFQIEYLCNLGEINSSRVTLAALPLKLSGSEGAPARVIALLD